MNGRLGQKTDDHQRRLSHSPEFFTARIQTHTRHSDLVLLSLVRKAASSGCRRSLSVENITNQYYWLSQFVSIPSCLHPGTSLPLTMSDSFLPTDRDLVAPHIRHMQH